MRNEGNLYAIYKQHHFEKVHIGNVRAINAYQAIRVYTEGADYPKEALSCYSAILAIKGIHYE